MHNKNLFFPSFLHFFLRFLRPPSEGVFVILLVFSYIVVSPYSLYSQLFTRVNSRNSLKINGVILYYSIIPYFYNNNNNNIYIRDS